EYKRGSSKGTDVDRIQLCAQAMALEEMLVCGITHGYLYYGETRRREQVEFTLELRNQVESLAKEMQGYAQRGYTPKGRLQKHCNACSLKDVCLPQLSRSPSVREYIEQRMEELV
ncbi:CRISPR-associated protein Cas4, partial [uncultured Merdimmobilis sp.]